MAASRAPISCVTVLTAAANRQRLGIDETTSIRRKLIAKIASSPYEPGMRSRSWLKVKVRGESEFVIGGFTLPQGSRTEFGALLAILDLP